MDLSFLYRDEDSRNMKNIYEGLCKIESVEAYHNGYYLIIYFKKSQFKVGKAAVLNLLQNYDGYKLIRENGKYKIMCKELC